MMKKLGLIILLCAIHYSIYSQHFARISYLNLTEDFGFVYKNPIGLEYGTNNGDFDERFQSYSTVGLVFAFPERKNFKSFGLLGGGGTDVEFLPLNTKYGPLGMVSYTYGGIFKFLKSSLTPFVGGDASIYLGFYKLESTGGLITSNQIEFIVGAGIRPNLGLIYSHSDDKQFQLSVGKFLSVPYNSIKIKYWQISLSCIFDI